MNKQEWLEELQNTRSNRVGLGMYTLDSFDEETAELLEKYSQEIKEKSVRDMANAIKQNLPNMWRWYGDEVDSIAEGVLNQEEERGEDY